MALKLGKCRLCLKLGDFYSIFTVDNAVQLAEMVMECTRVKIYDGDGLPDKICSECIQKLSSAYIFKQQCERSDQELRRNYVPPPGFSITPPPAPNRQSSDSAFSSQTDVSNQTKPSISHENTSTPIGRSRKRSRESIDNTSASSRSQDRAPAAKRVSELRDAQKKQRHNKSYEDDSDYEDHMSTSQFSAGTDSDEPLLSNAYKCKYCDRAFPSAKSLAIHGRQHKKESLGENQVVSIPKPSTPQDATDEEDKLSCDRCGKTFKLKIMLKRHKDMCGVVAEVSPQKELLISLEPIDAIQPRKLECEICTSKFKTIDNLNKHLRVVHAAAPKQDPSPIKESKDKKVTVPCIFCRKSFDDYYVYTAHHNSCNKRKEMDSFTCPVCKRMTGKRAAFFTHVKNLHFERSLSGKEEPKTESFDCRMCSKRLTSQAQLITHLAAHMSNIDEPDVHADDESRASTLEDGGSVTSEYGSGKYVSNGPLSCSVCEKRFTYRKALVTHMEKMHEGVEIPVKVEPPDKDPDPDQTIEDSGSVTSEYGSSKYVSNGPLSCSVCEKRFTYRKALVTHMEKVHEGVEIPVTEEPPDKDPDPDQTIEDSGSVTSEYGSSKYVSNGPLSCSVCEKRFTYRKALVTHMEKVHEGVEIPVMEEPPNKDPDPDQTIEDSGSVTSEYGSSKYASNGPLSCSVCEKRFTYRKALVTHMEKVHEGVEIPVKEDPNLDQSNPDLLSETLAAAPSDSESSDEDGSERTCDICEKEFSYKRLLDQHKRTKHNLSSGTKRAKITLKDCSVRCLICDLEMKVSDINAHNQKHISVNIKPRNVYTCADCSDKFKSCSALANHIKFVHRLKQPRAPLAPRALEGGSELADFCEVVVTKAEPLDALQGHNGKGAVPSLAVNATGFTCPLCGKVMGTLVSLKRHVNWHTYRGKELERNIECFVCKETFRFQCHFRLHMRGHYTDTNLDPKHLTCPICHRKSKHLRAAQAHMNFHKQTRFNTADYQCAICKRVYQHRKVYLSHMAIHFKKGESGMNTIVGDALPNNVDKTRFDGTNTCHICGKVCDSENSLKCHVRWHNSKSSLYGARHECLICNLVFTNKRRLELHTRTHYEDENGPYKCNVCGKGFIDEGYHRRHQKGHNFDHQVHKDRIDKLRKDKVKCPICARFYPDLIHLIRHLRRTHPESKMIKTDPDAPPPTYFSCKLCAKVFLDERRFRKHEEAHARKPLFFKCKFCGKNTISLKNHNVHIKGHLTQKYFDNPLKCTQCDETFVKGYDLHHHLRDVHQINETWIAERTEPTLSGPLKEFQCSICLKVLASKGNFERHIDYHNTLRCNYCFDYFSTMRFLEGHLAFSCDKKKLIGDTETYPKKIKCQVCYKAFHLQVKLDCHLRTQHGIKVCKERSSGKKEIVCDYCFRVFENEESLTGHKIYHRTVGYYGCIYCKRKFNTLTLYRKHKNHHLAQLNVDNPTKCEHCDETFVAFREMIYHMRDVHGDSKEWIVMPKDSIEETCQICNKRFFNLHRHLEYHEENRCKKCGEYFYSRVDYDNHLCSIESDDEDAVQNVDSSSPAYEECRFCFKPITRKSSKRKHDHIHKGSGSISCRFCPLKFKTIDAFNIHAFSHRSRKYTKKPIKCRKCGEKFVKYGPFMKHIKNVHKSAKKMHYRATVRPERCVVCGDDFPNLHNHYRAHLLNQCQQCFKYFTSFKVFSQHHCDKEDSDPSKVFVCDENLVSLINNYIPKDEKDDEKFYGGAEDEEEEEIPEAATPVTNNVEQKSELLSQDEDSQNADLDAMTFSHDEMSQDEKELHQMVSSPIISDVLSLYQQSQKDDPKQAVNDKDVVSLIDDDDSMDMTVINIPVITID